VDIGLTHSRPRIELGRGVLVEGHVTTLPMVKHLDVLKDVLYRVFTGRIVPMTHGFALQCIENVFYAGIGPWMIGLGQTVRLCRNRSH
jgi:hypothetical protein